MQKNSAAANNRKTIEAYIPMVKFIAAVCGPRCEVALHDLDDVDHSIVAIENGHITGRKVGDGLVDFALGSVFDLNNQGKAFVANLSGKTDDNKHLRMSGYFIRNEENEIIGLLNVTVDITDYLWMKSILDQELFMSGGTGTTLSLDPSDSSEHSLSAGEMVDLVCNQAMEQLGFTDPRKMRKGDKMKVIAMLNDKNLFAMKGIIKLTAKKLEVSEPSVYRYVREHRIESAARKEQP